MADLTYTFPTTEIGAGGVYGNQNVLATVDAESNLLQLWSGLTAQTYCRRVHFGFRAFELGHPAELLEPLVTSFYPAYQETVFGTEGVIVAQRVFAPFRAGYGDAVCWQLDLQAEGHRLLQIEVEIEWDGGETGPKPELRYQDGLIVARGGYSERATRVFGASGPPTLYDLDTAGVTRLLYHILIEGYIDVPFILSIAPSGEQLAWHGFLALSDLNLVFQDSNRRIDALLESAELITPALPLNRLLAWAKTALFKSVRRGRMGVALNPAATTTVDVACSAYAARAMAWIEPDLSRELLLKLRGLALRPDGGVVRAYHHYNGDVLTAPDAQATAEFLALGRDFLMREAEDPTLSAAVQSAHAWLNGQTRPSSQAPADAFDPKQLTALERFWLAREAAMPEQPTASPGALDDALYDELVSLDVPMPVSDSEAYRTLAAAGGVLLLAYEGSAGLRPLDADRLLLRPRPPAHWPWFLLLNLPYGDKLIQIIYYEGHVYADHPLVTDRPFTLCDQISRVPSAGVVLAVRLGDETRVFAANAADAPWSSEVKAFEQSFVIDLAPHEACWLSKP